MAHDHEHGAALEGPAHHHGHAHGPASYGRAFKIGISLNIGIVVVQAAFGWVANSVALIADAGHNLSDVLGLVVAYAAVVLSARKPSPRFTYGLGKSSILAALFNAVFLLVAVGALTWEAVERLSNPRPVAGLTVMVVAGVALVLNAFTAWLFASGRHSDLNLRGAFLHMAADAAVSAGVIVSGLVILLTGWLWVDPVASLVINAVIVWGTWSLLRHSLSLSLAAVPSSIRYDEVRRFLSDLPGVASLHDLHIWPLSTTQTALTAHLVMPAGAPGDAFLMTTTAELERRFGTDHVTLQVETGEGGWCELSRAHPA